MAVKYLFLTNDGLEEHPDLKIESFNATVEQNDYEVRFSFAFGLEHPVIHVIPWV
jgi:hypothetical protein